jgi:hypothetical protein
MSAEPAPAGAGIFARWTVRGLAVIGLLGCVAFIAVAAVLFDLSGPRYAPAKVETADTHEVFTVSNINPLRGTDLISMDVKASEGRGNGSLSGGRSGSDQRNIVLLNTTTGASRRVLQDNHRQISEFGFLPGDRSNRDDVAEAMAEGNATTKAVTSYYLVIAQPGDAGLADLMVGSVASEKQAVVLTGIDGVDSVWMPDATHIAVIVRDRRKLFYRIIDMSNFKVTASHPIAID